MLILLTGFYYQWMPAVIFLTYLMYGFLRPWLSRPWRRSIEQEIGEGDDDDDSEDGLKAQRTPARTPLPARTRSDLFPVAR